MKHIALLALLSASCAHVDLATPVVDDTPVAPALALAPPTTSSVLVNARDFVSAGQCTSAAAELYARAPKPGWSLLVACANRADFTDLEALVDEPWAHELKRRGNEKNGAQIVARVIARRGGNIDRDLRVCRRAGLRLFSLRAALADPEAMHGGFVVMRGAIADARRVRGARAIELDEMRPLTDDDVFFADEELVRRRFRRTSQPLDELSIETGLSVVARVSPDAIYEPAVDYVLLLRFDGEAELAPQHAKSTPRAALGTVLASYEPELSLLSWVPQR